MGLTDLAISISCPRDVGAHVKVNKFEQGPVGRVETQRVLGGCVTSSRARGDLAAEVGDLGLRERMDERGRA
jgi:hypothetical protein